MTRQERIEQWLRSRKQVQELEQCKTLYDALTEETAGDYVVEAAEEDLKTFTVEQLHYKKEGAR